MTARIKYPNQGASQQVFKLKLDIEKDKSYEVEAIRNSPVYNKFVKDQ